MHFVESEPSGSSAGKHQREQYGRRTKKKKSKLSGRAMSENNDEKQNQKFLREKKWTFNSIWSHLTAEIRR